MASFLKRQNQTFTAVGIVTVFAFLSLSYSSAIARSIIPSLDWRASESFSEIPDAAKVQIIAAGFYEDDFEGARYISDRDFVRAAVKEGKTGAEIASLDAAHFAIEIYFKNDSFVYLYRHEKKKLRKLKSGKRYYFRSKFGRESQEAERHRSFIPKDYNSEIS